MRLSRPAIRAKQLARPALRRGIFAVTAMLVALGACGESGVTDPYERAAGVFLLQSISGQSLPALIASGPSEGDVLVTTGSLFMSTDKRFRETLTVRVTPSSGEARNGTAVASGTYTIVGDSVEFSLEEKDAATVRKVQATLRGDTLAYSVFGRVVLYMKL